MPVYGVIAGDNNANPFAKSIIYYLMNRVARKHEGMVLKGYVDNISESTREEDPDLAIRTAVDAAVDTRDQLASLGFIVGESAIMTSDPRVTKLVHQQLRSEDLTIVTADEVPYLGIGQTLGKYKPRVIRNTRYRKGALRVQRIATLARTNRGSSKLYTTGAWPQAYHGQQAIGMSDSALRQARRDMVRCSGDDALNHCG